MTALYCHDCKTVLTYPGSCSICGKYAFIIEIPDILITGKEKSMENIVSGTPKTGKNKCNKCIYYFNGIGANPCETCNDFNNYQEKSMEKNEKFEEWFKENYKHVVIGTLNKSEKDHEQIVFEAGQKADEETIMCDKCFTYHNESANFCPTCGYSKPTVSKAEGVGEIKEINIVRCKNCHKTFNSAYFNSCTHCGHSESQYIPRSPDESKPLGEIMSELDHQTPNCQLCKWAYSFTKENNNSQYFSNCDAQGCQSAVEAYNTPECQALYEVEESDG